jgi:hypothetical protein
VHRRPSIRAKHPMPVASPATAAADGGSGNGHGKSNGTRPIAPNGCHVGQTSLRAALAASIDAALEAEQYAAAHGLSVRFGSEDLRAMALSLFIQQARDGGVR